MKIGFKQLDARCSSYDIWHNHFSIFGQNALRRSNESLVLHDGHRTFQEHGIARGMGHECRRRTVAEDTVVEFTIHDDDRDINTACCWTMYL